MSDKHLSSAFEAELNVISTRVRAMGALAESMFAKSMHALTHLSAEVAGEVLALEEQIDAMEVDIDRELSTALVRWQPAARDLRFLIAASKVISVLERIGDEAVRIARTIDRLRGEPVIDQLRSPMASAALEADLVIGLLRKSVDAFDRRDADLALQVIRNDATVQGDFEGLLRTLVTLVMSDARTISPSIHLVSVAKAIECVADHTRNLAEEVIYLVKGADVRHFKLADVESTLAKE